jgi:hypothetical protein
VSKHDFVSVVHKIDHSGRTPGYRYEMHFKMPIGSSRGRASAETGLAKRKTNAGEFGDWRFIDCTRYEFTEYSRRILYQVLYVPVPTCTSIAVQPAASPHAASSHIITAYHHSISLSESSEAVLYSL